MNPVVSVYKKGLNEYEAYINLYTLHILTELTKLKSGKPVNKLYKIGIIEYVHLYALLIIIS